MNCYAIIPAAGRSQRMGSAKLLLPWGERTVIEAVLDVWRASRVAKVVVVVHRDDLELGAKARQSGAEVVAPQTPPPDMRTSVLRALEWIAQSSHPAPTDAWLVAPADLPFLSPIVINRLIEAHLAAIEAGTDPSILVPTRDDRQGHPVLFPWPLHVEVARLAADQGLKALVNTFPTQTILCGEELVFDDLDSPDDYRRLHDRHNRRDRAS